jgi:hypothetical protein
MFGNKHLEGKLFISKYFNPLKTERVCVPLVLMIRNSQFLPGKCIYGFRMILRVNCQCYFKRHQPLDLCNGKVWCFLCGTDWIFKYYLDELSDCNGCVAYMRIINCTDFVELRNVGKCLWKITYKRENKISGMWLEIGEVGSRTKVIRIGTLLCSMRTALIERAV